VFLYLFAREPAASLQVAAGMALAGLQNCFPFLNVSALISIQFSDIIGRYRKKTWYRFFCGENFSVIEDSMLS
jgi:hypothetical protein